jgi:hypothetical protein
MKASKHVEINVRLAFLIDAPLLTLIGEHHQISPLSIALSDWNVN